MDASKMIAALEKTWQRVRRSHPDLPPAVMIVASGSEGVRLKKWGHWAALRWRVVEGRDVGEVLVAGERLQAGAQAVLETLLHEAAHALAFARRIPDTSRNGRYHNLRYKLLAEAVGLTVAKDEMYGYTLTDLRPETIARYQPELAVLERACTGYRRRLTTDDDENGTKGGRLLLECHCAPPRKLRVSPKIAEAGPILCGVCDAEFQPS